MAERKLGEEIMLEARETGQTLDDEETTEYLNQFGQNLVAHAPPSNLNFEFFAINDPNINAFALPGGFIAIHSGLLIAAQSESELASVMSHEMGHVIQRHIARKIGNDRQTSLLAMGAMLLAVIAASRASGNGSSDAIQASIMASQGYAIQQQLSFSRDAEREADRVGFQILQDSRFDVSAMVTFFGRLQQATMVQDTGVPVWLRTHPMDTERMADIQNRIREVHYRQRPDSLDFQLIRARMRVLQNETVQGLIDTRTNFQEQLRTGSYPSEIAVHYGLALVYARQKNFDGAQRELDLIHKMLPSKNAIIENFSIDLRQLAGDPQGAAVIAKAARVAFPLSRMIAISYADALQQAGKQDEAIVFLREQIQLYRKTAVFYELLGRSYAAKGESMLEHRTMAENYFLRGSPTEALEQLQMARRASNGDFYELSQIDVRIREMQALITERKKAEKEGKGKDGFSLKVTTD
jgi:predicted Zn-dependent protease